MTKNEKGEVYIPLFRRDLLKKVGCHYQLETLRKWKQIGKYKEFNLFKKLNGRLYLRLNGWNDLRREVGMGSKE